MILEIVGEDIVVELLKNKLLLSLGTVTDINIQTMVSLMQLRTF